jgi:5'-3' exonuclease
MAKKHTLVIDGNYFFFRTLYALPRGKGKLLDSENDIGIFIRKLAIDFASEVRRFKPIVDQIVFTVDSKSWRKDFFPESDYKGNREVAEGEETINWENFSKATDEFKTSLKDRGVILHKVPGAEGDDLIFAWSANLNFKGKSVIVFTGDRDLLQLVNYNESTSSYTIWYSNTHKKLCVFPGFQTWLDKEDGSVTDIFNMSNTISGENAIRVPMRNMIKEMKLSVEEIHASSFGFKKVLTGDAGDNVRSAYYYTTSGKSGKSRTYGITDKKAEGILEEFEKKHGQFKVEYFFEESYRRQICNLIVKQLNADKMPYEQILMNLSNNSNLVLLHQKAIPESIYNQLFDLVEKMQNIILKDFDKITSKEEILKGSSHMKETFSKSSDFFSGKDDSDDFSFIIKGDEPKTLF